MPENKYYRKPTPRAVRNGGVDMYDLFVMYEVTCPAIQHALKKLFCAGSRGAKGRVQDLEEALWSTGEAVELARDEASGHKTATFAPPEDAYRP
jgi:hypothetical protein